MTSRIDLDQMIWVLPVGEKTKTNELVRVGFRFSLGSQVKKPLSQECLLNALEPELANF